MTGSFKQALENRIMLQRISNICRNHKFGTVKRPYTTFSSILNFSDSLCKGIKMHQCNIIINHVKSLGQVASLYWCSSGGSPFFTFNWLPHSQLLVNTEETVPLTRCQSLRFVKFWPEGYRECCSVVGSLSPAERLVGFELGTLRFVCNALTQ